MNNSTRRKLQTEKRRVERRLERAVEVNLGGPVLGATNIQYQLSVRTKAIAQGGIGAVHRLVNELGVAACIDEALEAGPPRGRNRVARLDPGQALVLGLAWQALGAISRIR